MAGIVEDSLRRLRMQAVNRQDAFEVTEVDQQIAQVHGFQASGHFLIVAAVRAVPRH